MKTFLQARETDLTFSAPVFLVIQVILIVSYDLSCRQLIKATRQIGKKLPKLKREG